MFLEIFKLIGECFINYLWIPRLYKLPSLTHYLSKERGCVKYKICWELLERRDLAGADTARGPEPAPRAAVLLDGKTTSLHDSMMMQAL